MQIFSSGRQLWLVSMGFMANRKQFCLALLQLYGLILQFWTLILGGLSEWRRFNYQQSCLGLTDICQDLLEIGRGLKGMEPWWVYREKMDTVSLRRAEECAGKPHSLYQERWVWQPSSPGTTPDQLWGLWLREQFYVTSKNW